MEERFNDDQILIEENGELTKKKSASNRLQLVFGLYLTIFVFAPIFIGVILGIALVIVGDEDFLMVGTIYSELIIQSIIFIMVLLFVGKYCIGDIKKTKENFKGFVGYILIGIILIALMNFLNSFIEIEELDDAVNIIDFAIQNGYILPILVLTVIYAPITEELMFRKALFIILLERVTAWKVIVISGTAFGFMHLIALAILEVNQLFLVALPYMVMGYILGYVYYKTKENIYSVIFLHALNNLVAVLLMMYG